jgi:glycosyltransferase involved in cell wall biosynthesis
MRILFLTPQPPYPLHQGTAIRNFGLIQGLAKRHAVSLLSFAHPDPTSATPGPALQDLGPLVHLCHRLETVAVPPPRSMRHRALDTFLHPLPDMALRLASPFFAGRLNTWLEQETFDIVHVEGIEMTPYFQQLMDEGGAAERNRPAIVFDDHNCEYMLQKRYAQVDARIPRRWPGALYSLIQWQKLRRYEAEVCRRAHHVLAVSQTDAQALQALVPGLQVTVIPNGIDTDSYAQPDTDSGQSRGTAQPPTLIFIGKMDFRPNVDAVRWFTEAIWPRIQAKIPEARFLAVGQRPHRQLDHLRADPSVTLTGWVEQVDPYIRSATLYVVPLRMGSGTRLKLLEAMALGKAIVSTRIGAEGLTDSNKIANDRELQLVEDDDSDGFADAVIDLLHDPARRARLGAAARAFVRRHYDWQVIIPRLEALYARR